MVILRFSLSRLLVIPLLSAALASALPMAAKRASAACLTPNNVAITIRLPDYPMWKGPADAMRECGNVSVKFDIDAASPVPLSAASERLEAQLVGISNGGLHRLATAGLLRPLDDLVERHGGRLSDHQLIRRDGKVMAIAVAANTMVFAYHEDLFRQQGESAPRSQGQIGEVAQRLLGEGGQIYSHGFSFPLEEGWSLTQAFLDQYLGDGGSLFDAAGEPLIASPQGEAALSRIRALAGLMPQEPQPPLETGVREALEHLAAFRVPMGMLWASSASVIDAPATSRVAGKMAFVPVPPVAEGGRPASTLWWEGFAISIAATEEEAEAAFRVALEGLDEEMLAAHGARAAWLMPEFRPGRLSKAVIEAVKAGIEPFPASEHTDLLRRAMAPHLADALAGRKSDAEALAGAVADYRRVAAERGLGPF